MVQAVSLQCSSHILPLLKNIKSSTSSADPSLPLDQGTQIRAAPLWNIVPTAQSIVRAKEVSATVKNILVVSTIALEACEAFKQRHLTKFDALVMDCACQIRALMIACFTNSSNIDAEVEVAEKVILSAQEKMKRMVILQKQCSLVDVLQHTQISLDIPVRVHALITAYILTITKVSPPPFNYEMGDTTDVQALVKWGLSKKFANTVNRTARMLLSRYSVNFVQCAANLLPTQKVRMLQDNVSAPVIDQFGVQYLAFFALSDVVYRSSLQNKIPAVLIVDRHCFQSRDRVKLFYKPTLQGYRISSSDEFSPGICAWIIEAYSFGTALPDHSMVQFNLKHIFYAGAAQHSQYTNNLHKHTSSPADPRLEKWKNIAQKQGYCRENPSTCVIVHIYADLLDNHL